MNAQSTDRLEFSSLAGGQRSADGDDEGRQKIWLAIKRAAQDIAGDCAPFISADEDVRYRLDRVSAIPEVETWRLVEALSLLSVLAKADRVVTPTVLNLFGKTGPIEHVRYGKSYFLWAQPLLTGGRSALGARPDLVVTNSPTGISSSTVQRVIESKCIKNLQAPDIRQEFGKAFDMSVSSYFMWSYYEPNVRLVAGAKELGIDLVALGVDGKMRNTPPEHLFAYVAATLEEARREGRFAIALAGATQRAVAKFESN